MLRVTRATFGGTQPLTVGRSTYGIPPGARVAHARPGGVLLTYVLNVDGVVHCLIEAGEVPVPSDLQRPLKNRYFSH